MNSAHRPLRHRAAEWLLVFESIPNQPARKSLRGAPPDGPPAHFPGKDSTLLLI